MAESDHCMETPGEEFGLFNEEAVSLFSSSLNKALERQSNVIVSTITGLTEKLTKSNAGKNVPHVEEPTVSVNGSPGFEFKHEGHKIQFNFNQARYSKLSELGKLIQECDFQKAADIVKEEQAAILQRNKILKIADRHGWDTVSEYLVDPLADDTEDATKLRYAVSRAARKRSYRSKPYDKRRGNFAPNDFFPGSDINSIFAAYKFASNVLVLRVDFR
ncbi:uncharacterized protein LOC130046894 [Ostrea edulis]|uniref:uncharacterized protein LOC130046894 n=1 Tax=Ostrea edulis TaxID=37623 RepID=UPI0024AEC13F|nr:uncharacterized protein LOC130046894 [Ostrea edulis]